jgi:alpha/beta superfamily hydrolase
VERTVAAWLLGASLAGCGDDAAGPPGDASIDAGSSDGGADAGYATFDAGDAASYDGGVIPCTTSDVWSDAIEIHRDENVIIERVEYCAERTRLVGQVCRPVSGVPGPVVAYAHDGFGGLEADWASPASLCGVLAANGYVAVQPSFRGQDESGGTIEICVGEAADLDQIVRTAKAQSYARPGEAAVLGRGHGGCVALIALESRRTPVEIAIAIDPQLDWTRAHAQWTRLREDAEGMFAGQLDQLVNLIEAATGGPPGESAEIDMAYLLRSPLRKIDDLIAFGGGLFILQGTDDPFVPTAPACDLATMLPGSAIYHLLSDGVSVGLGVADCTETVSEWSAVIPRGEWPGMRYTGIYEGSGDLFLAGSPTFNDTVDYLTTRLPR